jgi:photosystem II stability/assembly factor-like uncharacterized protein
MKLKYFLLYFLLFPFFSFAQQDGKRIDIRRTNQSSQQSVEHVNKPKQEVFPLGYGTNHFGKADTGTGVWTELNPKVPRVTYIGLYFVNKDTGWACGQSGAIIKTTNGGDDWTISETPVNNLLLKTHSYNGQMVLVTGYDGIILRSSDGGENFEQVSSGVGNGVDLWGVQMLNDTLGWVCGLNQTLLKTTDAGLNWQQVTAGLNQHYWSLNFLNEQYGMIACGSGIVLMTTNGGNSWTQIQAGDTRSLYTIDVIDNLHIAAAGASGKNVYSSDAGATWISNQDLPAFTSTNWIEFIDADTGYTVQDVYDIRKTTNRGQTWFNPGGGGEWQIQLLEDGTGYSGGDELNLFKRTNGLDNWNKLIINNNWSDVFFENEMKGFFLSNGGLFKTEDGGIGFQDIENSPGGNVLTFVNENGFIGYSSYSRIYTSSDAGNTWNLVNISGLTDTIGRINKIFFVNPSMGWAVANGIIKTTDYGFNWFTQLNAGGFTSIYLVDSLHGWATVVGRRPYKTTNGGLNWIEQTNLNIWDSDDVFFRDYLNGCLIGFNELYKTTDSGTTWILDPNVTGFGIAELSTFQDSTLFIVGGKTFRSIDGGENWFEFSELNGITLTGLSLLNSGFGFAVGSRGLILRYDDGVTNVSPDDNLYPDQSILHQNFPNPFNPITKIKFEIPHSPPLLKGESEAGGFITLKVYDVLGNEIAILVNEEKQQGICEVEFDGTNLPSGVYFCQLRAQNYIQTIKMLLLK